ncbi:hypothetical protein ACHAXT_001153 [Thalassiosira profunda]
MFCGKLEPPESEFSECGRCAASSYCSKECQRQHWPQHKKRCPKYNNDEQKKAFVKVDGRITRFNGYFGPMLSKILAAKLALLQLENKSASNETHLVVVRLTELPEEAKKPRLRLNDVGTMALADLPDPYRSHMEHGMRQNPPGLFVIPYLLEVKFSAGGTPAMRMKPGMTAFEANPLLDPRMPKTKAHLSLEENSWINMINDLAEGRQEDLRRAIKKKMRRK